MTEAERQKYLEAYYENEANANKHMSIANAITGVYMIVIWILYLTDVFKIHSTVTFVLINIIFPVSILILLSPLLYAFVFKKHLRHPRYKYFVLFSFVVVIAGLNQILPKHSAIAWALCIIMTNHYFNPKVGIVVFISVLVLSLVSMYGGMFVGEFDANLLLGNESFEDGILLYANGPRERFELLHTLLEQGHNRYLDNLFYYYVPRSILLSLVFFVSYALNIRTYRLLVSEIQVNSEQQKTKTELEVAKEIQLATLPTELVVNKDIEIQAELKAAKEVGGDFYDYFILDNDHVGLLIGDVSGKGIPAAMFMMKTITCFRNLVSSTRSPSDVLKEVNRVLNKGNDSSMFVTCFYAVINIKNGEMRFANAGHNRPIIGQTGNYSYLKCQTGFVLGALAEVPVNDEVTTLNNGDTITLYTDGLTEAKNEHSELYGEERLINVFNKKEYSCLVEMHHSIKDDIAKFVGKAEQSDDMTYITLKYHGDHYTFEEKFFKGTKENVPAMLEFVEHFAHQKGFDPSFINNLAVVADEMLSNIVKYGYKDYVDVIFIRLLFNIDKKEFVFTIIDKCEEFNPFEVDNKPLEGDVSGIAEGGLGILIVKKLMTEYAHDYINHKNIVMLKKRF